MRKPILLVAACLAALVPAAAQAQDTEPEPVVAAETPAEKGIVPALLPLVTAAAPDSGAGIQFRNYAISASTDDNVLTFTLAPVAPQFDGATESALNATVKVPLGASLGEALGTTVAEPGLSDKFSGTISYSLIHTNFGTTESEGEAGRQLFSRCEALKEAAAAEPQRLGYVTAFCNGGGLRGLTREQLKFIAGNDSKAQQAVDTIIRYQNRKNNAKLYILNISGSTGTRAYKSQDPTSFTERSTSRTSVAVSITGAISFGKAGLFIGAGYQYRRDYSDPEKRSVCPPGVTTGCPTEIFDLPTADIDHSAFALTRFRLPIPMGGVNPLVEVRIAYDFEDKLWGLQVPVYFLTNDDGGFRGGVRFTWESRPDLPPGARPDKPNTSFGVFFVKSFDQLGL